MRVRVWGVLALLGLAAGAVQGGVIDSAQRAAAQQAWSASGGELGVRWNRDLLGNLGVSLEAVPAQELPRTDTRRHIWFALRDGPGLQFKVAQDRLQGFAGGALQMRGGYVLHLRDGSRLDLREMSLRARAADPRTLDGVGSDGQVWFQIDHLMYELVDGQHTLAIHAADLRIAKALAERLGAPDAAGWYVADLALDMDVGVMGSNEQPTAACTPFPWPGVAVPGVPGATYQVDLFMKEFPTVDAVGCISSTGSSHCDGPGGDDGINAMSLSSKLINNVNDGTAVPTVPGDPLGTSSVLYTAAITWNRKFTGSFAPYNNDQTAYILWNLYRTNADGSLEQIGRSGVKHTYHNSDNNCINSCNDNGSNIVGRGCQDEYSTGNNDSPADMGPRSEIVPATGIWGRCGSIFDPNCTGVEQIPNGNDSWTQRMKTRESQLDPALNAGASYLFEARYVVRDDADIYHGMATVQITPTWSASGNLWLPRNPSNYRLGPAIDRWVDPANPPANAKTTELAAPEGHTKVAVKTTDLGGGSWRYDYAVMNLDFARAVTQPAPPGSGPDPRVVSDQGFDSFSIPIPAGSTVTATRFRDSANSGNAPWTVAVGSSSVTWSSAGSTLDWESLYAFSMTIDAAPGAGSSALHVAQTGSPAAYGVATLVPGGAALPAPQATVTPASVTLDATQGGTGSGSFNLANTGATGSTLTYTLGSSSGTCASPVNVPWFSLSPPSGTVAAGSSTPIGLSVDASNLATGAYSLVACVNSDDAVNPQISVPVMVTVQPNPDIIFANGFE